MLVLLSGIASVPGVRRGLIDPAGRAPAVDVDRIEMRDDFWEYFAFTPPVISVEAGTTVTWTSTSGTAHNAVFAEGDDSPLLDAGESWSRTFPTPGEYPYVCTLHEGMDGRVIVRPAGT